jgi:UDP-galactopyranose mutase
MAGYDVIVVGAGFAGAVFARKMADAGRRVLVLEKRARIGGNMFDEPAAENAGNFAENKQRPYYVHKYGPHIFHTNNSAVFAYLQQFSAWYEYRHRVLGIIDGQAVPIPFNFTSIDKLFPQTEADNLKQKLSANFGVNTRLSIFDLIQSADTRIAVLGNFILEKVFVNYTAKQWGVPIEQVDTSTINRVPVVSGYDDRYFQDAIQMMPSGGFTALFKNMLAHENIEVRLNINAKEKFAFDYENKKVFFEGGAYAGLVFFTGALDEFLGYKHGEMPYRSLDLVFEEKARQYFQDAAVVNYPNEEAYTRITEFKHFFPKPADSLPDAAHSKTTILKEYPAPYETKRGREPYYPVINEKNNAVYQRYAASLAAFDNVYLCGRLAEYKYYNMDAAAARALEYAEKIIRQ